MVGCNLRDALESLGEVITYITELNLWDFQPSRSTSGPHNFLSTKLALLKEVFGTASKQGAECKQKNVCTHDALMATAIKSLAMCKNCVVFGGRNLGPASWVTGNHSDSTS